MKAKQARRGFLGGKARGLRGFSPCKAADLAGLAIFCLSQALFEISDISEALSQA